MRILLLNPPHPSIGSRIPDEHLPPLGLLSVGGPLIDAGHEVRLLDAEFGPLSTATTVDHVVRYAPQAVLLGHSGSTSGQPAASEITRAIRAACPHVWIIYGGVFPTFHWQDILCAEPQIDIIVRGEGEETARQLIHALESGQPLDSIAGIAFREDTISAPYRSPDATTRLGVPRSTLPAPIIDNLDAYRVGWELIDHARYSYWGNRRAVVAQFSRGCPHNCTYCGQRPFWRRWRHRDPVRFAAELARLHREQGVEVINFADENPTASRPHWKAFLEALIAQNVPRLILVGSTRADDIVRDADILHLYKRAGVARFLMGMESTDEQTLQKIRKGTTTSTDREAIRLLRQHGILSMVAFVAGFDEEETDRSYWRTLRQLISYDPDQIQGVYATPHRWTPFHRQSAGRQVIQTDLRRWDYKHQVLASRRMPPWRILLWMKAIEAIVQLRPKALWRNLAHPDRGLRAAMRWYSSIGRRVWPYEIGNYVFGDRRTRTGPVLADFWRQVMSSGAEGSAETSEARSSTRRLSSSPSLRAEGRPEGSHGGAHGQPEAPPCLGTVVGSGLPPCWHRLVLYHPSSDE